MIATLVRPLRRPPTAALHRAASTAGGSTHAVTNQATPFLNYNAFDDHLIVESDLDVPVGSSELGVHIRRTGGKTGTIAVSVDGAAGEPAELPLFMTMMSSVGPSVGYDHGSAVSQRYAGPFPFAGTLHEVTVQLLSRDEVEAQRAEAAIEMSRQ